MALSLCFFTMQIVFVSNLHKLHLDLLVSTFAFTQPCFQGSEQSLSEVRTNKAVDDEVDGGVEHDQVPDDAVRHPPARADVVPALPLVTVKDVGDC